FFSVGGGRNAVARSLEHDAQHIPHTALVVNDQDFFHGSRLHGSGPSCHMRGPASGEMGRQTTKRDPFPTWLSTSIHAPLRSTMHWTVASSRPDSMFLLV